MSSRYSETRSVHEENRRSGNNLYDIPFQSQVTVPIQHSSSINRSINEQQIQDRIRQHDSSLQWVNDPISGKEKFRININIDGFNQNEVNIRVDGTKLYVSGQHLENSNQSSAKKSIEKSYELPRDVDPTSPHVTFPTSTTMQVDFPSRYSNVIIDDGRTSTNLTSSFNTSHRTPPRLAEEKSSTEYTSTRKIGNTGGSTFIGSSIPRNHSPYDDLYGGSNIGRNTSYSSTSNYQTSGNQRPLRQDYTTYSANPTHTFNVTTGSNFQPRTTFPSTSFGNGNGNVYEKSYTEKHHETQHQRSSPTTGVQSSHEVEHSTSGDPSISRGFEADRFRPTVTFNPPNITSSPSTSTLRSVQVEHNTSGNPSISRGFESDHFRPTVTFNSPNITSSPSTSRNVEVREYSRRIGNTGNNTSSFINTEPSIFSHGFNQDAFYRSAFQPQVLTDDHGQKRIEMKLPVSNYQPNEIKVKIEGNDLIVQAEHKDEHPPTSSSRAYYFKQVTLPANTDLSTLSSQYNPDGRLHITAKLSPAQTSIRYN